MSKQLIIAEKPSVGRTIATVLGGQNAKKENGYIESDSWIVTWCRGHLVTNAMPEAYAEKFKKWTMEDLPIVPERWKLEPIKTATDQLAVVSKLAHREDVSELIEATDAGREGELIFRLTYLYIGCKKPFRRLWVSSLEASAIREGFKTLKPSSQYDNLYKAALARSRADWLFGLNGSRYYTLISSEDGVKSVGRVQTPTLAMIVKRQEEIENFKVTNRWAVQKKFDTWSMETELFLEQAEADKCLKQTDGKGVTITKIEKKKKKMGAPLLYSLSTLQQDMNKKYGYTAMETLDLMQTLYEKKILTYPRADSNYITSEMEGTMENIIENLISAFGRFVPNFKNTGVAKVINDSKVGDHHAILITEEFSQHPDTSQLTDKERQIVRLVEVRILEAVSAPYEYEETKAAGTCGDYTFTGSGSKVLFAGWKEIAKAMLSLKDRQADVLPPDLEEGKSYQPQSTEIVTRDTTPPKFYTDETLLHAMEKAGAKEMDDDVERKGLGTSATRAAVIETLLNRKYIERDKKYLKATLEGKNLIAKVDDGFKNVDTTVDWENRLLEIERGNGESLQEFCSSIEQRIRTLLANGPKEAAKKNQKDGVVVGTCPLCGKEMKTYFSDVKCGSCGVKLYRTKFGDTALLYTDAQVASLLKGEKVKVKRLSKEGKPFDSLMSLDLEATKQNIAEGKNYFMTKMEFENKPKGRKNWPKKKTASSNKIPKEFKQDFAIQNGDDDFSGLMNLIPKSE
jgi:DNA topoisomerase III